MYYLVRDYYDETEKKIFSDKDDIEEWIDELDPDKRVQLLVYNWEDGMHSDCRNGRRIYFDQYFILKKSENVFDFVEVGDLVKFAWNNRNDNCPISIRKVYSIKKHKDNGWLTVDYELAIYDDEVLAIYKPNKNGDYIKVWERMNENDR